MSYAIATRVGVITQSQLDSYLGKSIGAICPNGYANDHDDHGAHFVSHVLGCKFGVTCQITGKGSGPAATLRVPDLFPQCRSVGVWSLRPASISTCLVFMARASSVNIAGKVMASAPRKHVGIYLNGFIWHYSNRRHQVLKETPPQFKLHYQSPDNAMFYGLLP